MFFRRRNARVVSNERRTFFACSLQERHAGFSQPPLRLPSPLPGPPSRGVRRCRRAEPQPRLRNLRPHDSGPARRNALQMTSPANESRQIGTTRCALRSGSALRSILAGRCHPKTKTRASFAPKRRTKPTAPGIRSRGMQFSESAVWRRVGSLVAAAIAAWIKCGRPIHRQSKVPAPRRQRMHSRAHVSRTKRASSYAGGIAEQQFGAKLPAGSTLRISQFRWVSEIGQSIRLQFDSPIGVLDHGGWLIRHSNSSYGNPSD